MTVPRHQPPGLDADDLKSRRKVTGAGLHVAVGQAKGTSGLPSLARIHRSRWVAVGAPELAGTELAAVAGVRAPMKMTTSCMGGSTGST